MPINEKESQPLREVSLESIAAYLRCDAGRLATALRKLAETPSAVFYGLGAGACISPVVVLYSLAPEAEVRVLEELLLKPDTRGLPGGRGDEPVVLTSEELAEGAALWALLPGGGQGGLVSKRCQGPGSGAWPG